MLWTEGQKCWIWLAWSSLSPQQPVQFYVLVSNHIIKITVLSVGAKESKHWKFHKGWNGCLQSNFSLYELVACGLLWTRKHPARFLCKKEKEQTAVSFSEIVFSYETNTLKYTEYTEKNMKYQKEKYKHYHFAGGSDCMFVTPPSTGTTTCTLDSMLGTFIDSGLYL